MARFNDNSSLYQSQTIIVNGVSMSIKDYKAMKKAKSAVKAKKRNKQETRTIKLLPNEIKDMMRSAKVLKSLVAYHEWGYKQWGNIAKLLMGMKEIKEPFNNVVVNTKQAVRLVDKINEIAKKNDKDVFQYVKKLSWKLEDVQTQLDELVNGISSSGIMSRFGQHECINGEGKRLGLRILTQRSKKTIGELGYICHKLDTIEKNGLDTFEYDINGNQIK